MTTCITFLSNRSSMHGFLLFCDPKPTTCITFLSDFQKCIFLETCCSNIPVCIRERECVQTCAHACKHFPIRAQGSALVESHALHAFDNIPLACTMFQMFPNISLCANDTLYAPPKCVETLVPLRPSLKRVKVLVIPTVLMVSRVRVRSSTVVTGFQLFNHSAAPRMCRNICNPHYRL